MKLMRTSILIPLDPGNFQLPSPNGCTTNGIFLYYSLESANPTMSPSRMKDRSLKCVMNVSTMSASGFRNFGVLASTPTDNVNYLQSLWADDSAHNRNCQSISFPVSTIFTLLPSQALLCSGCSQGPTCG